MEEEEEGDLDVVYTVGLTHGSDLCVNPIGKTISCIPGLSSRTVWAGGHDIIYSKCVIKSNLNFCDSLSEAILV